MYKQVIVIRSDLKMGKGKMAAQACHASIESFRLAIKYTPDTVASWLAQGQKKVVLKIGNEREMFELYTDLKKMFPAAIIRDAGMTQLSPGTATCFAVGPVHEDDIDQYIEHLKLM